MPAPIPPVRASAWEWALAAVLSANIAWTTLCLGGYLPGTRVAMVAMTAVLIAVHFCDPGRAPRNHPAGWLFLPFLAYAACNAAWLTPVHWLGWTDWLNWAQAIAVFWVVLNGVRSPACRRFLCLAIVGVAVVSAGMAAYQHFIDPHWIMLVRFQADQYIGRAAGSFGNPNSQGVFMALLIPPVAAFALDRGRSGGARFAAVLILGTLACAFILAISRGAWLALAGALILRSLFGPGQSAGRRIAGAAAVFAGAAAALAILYFSFPLMRERVMQFANDAGERSRPIVWRGAWDIFREHPVFGGGAGSFNVLFEAFRPEGFRNDPIYAHCDYLNTLCDYGLVGFVLLLGAAAIVAWHCAGSRGIFGAAFTGLLAFSLHLLVDFHLKLPALAMIFATVSAFVTAQAWPLEAREADSRNPSKAVGICVAAAALFLALAWAIPKYRADETSRAARDRIDKMALKGVDISKEADALAAIRDAFGRAVAMDPSNAQAWSDKAYADTLWALVDPTRTHALGVSAADEADRAIALSPIVAEFWIRKGSGLDMQQRWIEGGECTAKALQLAPTRADIWYYCAYHLSLNPAAAESATAAVNLCLRLDPSFLLAQALRQRLSVQ